MNTPVRIHPDTLLVVKTDEGNYDWRRFGEKLPKNATPTGIIDRNSGTPIYAYQSDTDNVAEQWNLLSLGLAFILNQGMEADANSEASLCTSMKSFFEADKFWEDGYWLIDITSHASPASIYYLLQSPVENTAARYAPAAKIVQILQSFDQESVTAEKFQSINMLHISLSWKMKSLVALWAYYKETIHGKSQYNSWLKEALRQPIDLSKRQ